MPRPPRPGGVQGTVKDIAGGVNVTVKDHYPDYCGPDRVEVRGHVIDVWAYHTGGWSGNEQIIGVLQSESFMWGYLLERYDAGGHFYFKPLTWLEQFLGQADSSDS